MASDFLFVRARPNANISNRSSLGRDQIRTFQTEVETFISAYFVLSFRIAGRQQLLSDGASLEFHIAVYFRCLFENSGTRCQYSTRPLCSVHVYASYRHVPLVSPLEIRYLKEENVRLRATRMRGDSTVDGKASFAGVLHALNATHIHGEAHFAGPLQWNRL
jgi:hypothetical protein